MLSYGALLWARDAMEVLTQSMEAVEVWMRQNKLNCKMALLLVQRLSNSLLAPVITLHSVSSKRIDPQFARLL